MPSLALPFSPAATRDPLSLIAGATSVGLQQGQQLISAASAFAANAQAAERERTRRAEQAALFAFQKERALIGDRQREAELAFRQGQEARLRARDLRDQQLFPLELEQQRQRLEDMRSIANFRNEDAAFRQRVRDEVFTPGAATGGGPSASPQFSQVGDFRVFSGSRDQIPDFASTRGNRAVSLDFNDAANRSARGVEVVVPRDATAEERRAAQAYVDEVQAFFQAQGVEVPVRGVKQAGDPGVSGKRGVIHTEPFFAANAAAREAIRNNPDEYAGILGRTLGSIPGVTFIAPHTQRDQGANSDGESERQFALDSIIPALERLGNGGESDAAINAQLDAAFAPGGPQAEAPSVPDDPRMAVVEAEQGALRLASTIGTLERDLEDAEARLAERQRALRQIAGVAPESMLAGNRAEVDAARDRLSAAGQQLAEVRGRKVQAEALLEQQEAVLVGEKKEMIPATHLRQLSDRRGSYQTALKAQQILAELPEGSFQPLFERAKRAAERVGFSAYDETKSEFLALRQGLANLALKDRSGAAVTPQEMERFVEEIGDPTSMSEREFKRRTILFFDKTVRDYETSVQAFEEGGYRVPSALQVRQADDPRRIAAQQKALRDQGLERVKRELENGGSRRLSNGQELRVVNGELHVFERGKDLGPVEVGP